MTRGLNPYLMRVLLTLYPRAWRDRYGAEVASLTDELIRAGDTTPRRGALNLLAGALIERGRALARSWRVELAAATAAIIAVAGSIFATTYAQPEPAPASLTGLHCAFRSGSPDLALVPAGTKPGQFSRALVPVRVAVPARPSRAHLPPGDVSGPCVLVPALCRVRPGKPDRAHVPVPVEPGQCVIAAPELCRIAAGTPLLLPRIRVTRPGKPAITACPAFRRLS
jgi:hypothetical protein